MTTRILSSKEIEWAYQKWCEGYTQMQIANALFVCEKTVQRTLRGKPRIRPVLICPERIKQHDKR